MGFWRDFRDAVRAIPKTMVAGLESKTRDLRMAQARQLVEIARDARSAGKVEAAERAERKAVEVMFPEIV